MSHLDNQREIAQAAGFDVREDPDQEGLWLWRMEDGEGSDISFDTEEEAWANAAADATEMAMMHADLSDEDWDTLSSQQQVAQVKAAFASQ